MLLHMFSITNPISHSAILPHEKTNRTPVKQYAALWLIIEVTAEVDATDDMPCSSILLFKSLFYVLSQILEVFELSFYQLPSYVFCYQESVFLHLCLHVAVFDFKRKWHICAYPVFRDTSTSGLLFVFALWGLVFLLLCLLRHLKFQYFLNWIITSLNLYLSSISMIFVCLRSTWCQ